MTAPSDDIAAIIDSAPEVEAAQVPDAENGKDEPPYDDFSLEKMNDEFALVLMGSKAVVMHEQPLAPIEDRRRVLSIEAFQAWFRNRFTTIYPPNDKPKVVTWAARWLASPRRRQYAGIEFAPGIDGARTPHYYNLWRGFSVEPQASGSYAILADHLLTNVCNGDRVTYHWVLAWFAHIVQRPTERIGTALVLRGAMGTGKTKIGEVFGSLIAAHYFMVDDPRYVTGQFNAHMASCLLLQAEEAVWAGDKAAEGRLKGLITSKFQMIEQKGIDPIRLDNYVRLIMTSNEDWVVPAGKDERRFCVLDVAPHVAQNHEYFREMDEELAAGGRSKLLYDLLSFDLSTVNLRQIPMTAALLEQKIRSLDSVEGWWFERLREGAPTRGMNSWPPAITKRALFDDYIAAADRIGVKRRSVETEMGMKLGRLMPQLSSRKAYDDGTTARVWHFMLPPLNEARAAFERAVGQEVEWPQADDAPPREMEEGL